MNRVVHISVSLAFGPHSCATTVNATVGGLQSGGTVCFTPMLFPKVLNAKQREIACTTFQVFGMTQPGIKSWPATYNMSILPLGHGCGYIRMAEYRRRAQSQVVNW